MENPFSPPEVSDIAVDVHAFPAYCFLRIAGAILDSAIVIVATAIVSSVPWAAARPIYGPTGINFLRPIWLFAIPLIFICISFGYHAVAVARYGTTFGKRLFKIQIRSITGSSVDFRQSFIRTAVSWVSLLLLGLGYLMMFFNEHRRTLHDFASGTLAAHNRITKS